MHELIQAIRAFLDRTGMKPTGFGRDALGDPNLLRQLGDGRELLPRTERRVRDFMARWEAEHGSDT